MFVTKGRRAIFAIGALRHVGRAGLEPLLLPRIKNKKGPLRGPYIDFGSGGGMIRRLRRLTPCGALGDFVASAFVAQLRWARMAFGAAPQLCQPAAHQSCRRAFRPDRG